MVEIKNNYTGLTQQNQTQKIKKRLKIRRKKKPNKPRRPS